MKAPGRCPGSSSAVALFRPVLGDTNGDVAPALNTLDSGLIDVMSLAVILMTSAVVIAGAATEAAAASISSFVVGVVVVVVVVVVGVDAGAGPMA